LLNIFIHKDAAAPFIIEPMQFLLAGKSNRERQKSTTHHLAAKFSLSFTYAERKKLTHTYAAYTNLQQN